MVSRRFREGDMNQSYSMPYSRVLEALRSAWQACRPGKQGRKRGPNRFVICFSPEDRKFRYENEDVFIDEITRDILYLESKLDEPRVLSKIQVEIRTDKKLNPGRIRVECHEDDRLLYRFEQDEDMEYLVDSEGNEEEWTAVDILPKEDSVGKCILVVDDEPVLCAVLQRILTKLDYQVVSAHDGLEATKILSQLNIDLVISDLRMPKMDGWALMRYVKNTMPDLPIILITGYHSIHTESKASESSADGYISKPFSVVQIKELLDSVLSKSENAKTSTTYISR